MESSPKIDHASEITTFFNTHRGITTSIEFYPSTSPLQISGPNIAIPKSYLLAAFTTAFSTFNSLLSLSPWSAEDAESLLDATLILILVAVEHTTAVNIRRRILTKGFIVGDEELVTSKGELKLLEGILTSQLVKHTKSSSLWYYRRWIVEQYGVGVLGEDGLEGELRIITKSGEVHPRNYYAWSYARYITDKFYALHPEKNPPLHDLIKKHAPLCMAHISDTSFWSFLLFLFFKNLENDKGAESSGVTFDIIKEVMIFAHGIAKGHESVWVFVRTVLADERLLEETERKRLIEMMEGWVEGERSNTAGNDEMNERELEKKALEWISRRGTKQYPRTFPSNSG